MRFWWGIFILPGLLYPSRLQKYTQQSFLADERYPDSGTEAAVRHIIYPVHLLDDEVFHLVVGNDELGLFCEALEDRGHDGRLNKTPGSSRFSPNNSVPIGVIFPGSANFVDEV